MASFVVSIFLLIVVFLHGLDSYFLADSAFALDTAIVQRLFQRSCVGCHVGGGNIIQPVYQCQKIESMSCVAAFAWDGHQLTFLFLHVLHCEGSNLNSFRSAAVSTVCMISNIINVQVY